MVIVRLSLLPFTIMKDTQQASNSNTGLCTCEFTEMAISSVDLDDTFTTDLDVGD